MNNSPLPTIGFPEARKENEPNDLSRYFVASYTDDRVLDLFDHPARFEGGALCICLKGSCSGSVNLNDYMVRPNDVIFVPPGSIVQWMDRSPDFKACIIGFSFDFMHNIDLPSILPIYSLILEHPRLSVSPEEVDDLLAFFSLLDEKSKKKSCFSRQLVQHLLLALLFEIGNMYQKKEMEVRDLSTNEKLLRRLLMMIFSSFRKERRVAYYAQELCLTPKYLSTIVKNLSGRTVSEWIDEAVLREARALLKTTDMTVQQISDSLNFPNPSFFGRYFRQHTGMTPREYRCS